MVILEGIVKENYLRVIAKPRIISISFSKAVYFSFAGLHVFEKKEISFHYPLMNCSRTAPIARSDASFVMQVAACG